MDNKTAIELVKNTFSKILKANNVKDLESILDNKLFTKTQKNLTQYPKLEIKIEKKEMEKLNYINDDFSFNAKLQENLNDPLLKILFATIWKNGDLHKVKCIIKGILESDLADIEQNSALVFYQFGKHLSNDREPIIDQHVIRAFNIYQNIDEDKTIINVLRTMKTITNNHNAVIKQYKDWLNSAHEVSKISNFKEYSYHVDNILFALGKAIKLKN